MMPTENSMISVFIIIPKSIDELPSDNTKTLTEIRRILKTSQMQREDIEYVWIPSFESKRSTSSIQVDSLETNLCSHVLLASYAPRELYLKTAQCSSYTVQNDFIIGLLHDNMESLELPLYWQVVSRSEWRKHII